MADHGRVLNSKMYWTYTGPDGKPAVSDTAPIGGSTGIFGSGINASPAPPSTQYHEITYEDGTKILSHWDTTTDAWTQDSYDVDSSIRAQSTAGGPKAPPTRTLPDGTMEEMLPDGTWHVIGTKPQGPPAPSTEPPTIHTKPDGSQEQWNPATRQWEPYAAAAAKPGTAPALNLPAARPGQKTDLNLVEAQGRQFIAGVYAETNLSEAQRTAKIAAYMEANVYPKLAQANQEANDYAAVQAKRQADIDARAQRTEQRQLSTEERQTRTAEETAALARATFGQKAGQDAVSNALALLPYQGNATFAREFAAGLNTLSSGGGPVSFSPEAFQVQLPDLGALAEQAAQRASAMYQSSSAVPFTPRPAAGAVAPTGPPAPASLESAPFVPPSRPSMPGAATAPAPLPPSAMPSATPGVVPPVAEFPIPPGANRDQWWLR